MSRPILLISISFAFCAAAAEPEWETVSEGPITVKSRPHPNSDVREVWAEGEMSAPVQDLQEALTNMDRFRHFMPYVKSARRVSLEPDGSSYNYTELDLPVISSRDYVVHTVLDEGVQPDGSGAYRTHWNAAPTKLPERRYLVRLKLCEGSWVITPGENGKSHFVYRLVTDPGGMIPAWLANYANTHGIGDTVHAIEKEGQRLQKAREATLAAQQAAALRAAAATAPEAATAAAPQASGAK